MAEVFISYARADQGFARDLNDALQNLDRNTWIDWRSIPDSAEWRAEIFAAIDAADNFLFIISADSLRSEMCEREVAHAFAANKRVITILYHPVERKDLFPRLGEIQWINYPELGLKETFRRVITAIDTNVPWVRQHTRLGEKAREWERNRGNESFLLRGMDLQDAVKWLAEASSAREPKPLPLHEEYIRKSQEWEAGEIKRLTELTEEKERQRLEAERQSRFAIARELVAFSTLSLEEDPERSILLGMHAVAATRAANHSVTPEAEDVLHRALLRSPIRLTLNGLKAAISSDGTRVVVWAADKTLRVVECESGAELLKLQDAVYCTDLAVSADGRRALLAYVDNTLGVWDLACGARLWTFATASQPKRVAINADGTRAVSVCLGGSSLQVWDLVAGVATCTIAGEWDDIRGLSMDADGRRTIIADVRTLKVWDIEAGCEIRTFSIDPPHEIFFCVDMNADGRLAVSGSSDKLVQIWDIEGGREIRALSGHSQYVDAAVISADGRSVVSASDRELKVWDAASGRELLNVRGGFGDVRGLTISGDGHFVVSISEKRFLALSHDDKDVKVWSLDGGSELACFASGRFGVDALALSRDGRILISASDRKLKVWDMNTRREVQVLLGHTQSVNGVAVSGDGRFAASVSQDCTMRIWNVETGSEVHVCEHVPSPLYGVALSDDGRCAISATADWDLIVWNAQEGKRIARLTGHSREVRGVVLSRDGRRALSGSDDGSLRVWDVQNGRRLTTWQTRQLGILAVAVTPDWRIAASASNDSTVKLWDLETGSELRSLSGHMSIVESVAMSPDGRRVASASADESVRIWDVETGNLLISFSMTPGYGGGRCVVWSADGTRLIIGNPSGTIHVYAMDIDLLMSLARSRVTRNLTPEECRKYLHRDDVPPIP